MNTEVRIIEHQSTRAPERKKKKIFTCDLCACNLCCKQGFTLIELMIAVLLSSLIAASIYFSFFISLNSWRKSQIVAEVYQNARIALSQMSREIRGAFLSKDSSYYRFIGESDTLNFISTSSGLDGLCEIGYYIGNDDDIDAEPELMRRCDVTIDTQPLKGGTTQLLAKFARYLNFRYFDGEEWQDVWFVDDKEEWQSEKKNSLPKAIEIRLTMQHPKQEKEFVFSTTVILPMSPISLKKDKQEEDVF